MSRRPEEQSAVRARLVVALALAAAVVAGGVTLEQEVGVRPLGSAEPPVPETGAWFCPHAGGDGWRAWVSVANPGTSAVSVELTTYGRRAPSSTRETVEAGSLRFVEVPAPAMAAGTRVEFLGGHVAAGMVLSRPRGRGLGAEPCAPEASTTWYAAEGTTVRGHAQHLVLLNPFDQEAILDVALSFGDETIRHGRLQGVVIPPRRAAAFELNRFALGKRALAATVTVGLGRVVAAGVGLLEQGGLRLSLGNPRPGRSWALPGAGDDLPTEVVVLGSGDRAAPFRARVQGEGNQRELLSEASVEPGTAQTHTLPARGAGVVVEAEGPQGFVAARRLLRRDTPDQASTAGAASGAAPGASWIALPALPPTGGRSLLVVQNPTDEVAEARVRLVTATGPAEAPSIARLAVPPGRVRIVPLEELVGEEPVAVVVESIRGRLVVAQAALPGTGYAVALGAPTTGT